MIKICIATDYSKTPGGRYMKEGMYSGEDFRIHLLKPKYIEAKERGETLQVDLDGGYGYGSSFLEEAFGGLVRDLRDSDIASIEIVSNEEPELINKIAKYIKEALKND